MKKKAQMEIGESIAVMFVIIILLVIGLVVYFQITQSNIQKQAEKNRELETTSIVQRVQHMPELLCTSMNVPVLNCFDLYRVQEFVNISINNRIAYYDLLGFSNITITKLYPPPKQTWQIYENAIDYKSKRTTAIPISIYDPVNELGETYYFGYVEVQSYYD